MRVLKHNKYKNTGLIFEILTRKLVAETFDKKSAKTSFGFIRKHFNEGSELRKEAELYRILQDVNLKIKNPIKLLETVLDTYHQTIDKNKLAKEKYNLIGDIKAAYNIDDFFNSRVSDYRLLGSCYKLFEYNANENPVDYSVCREMICEHITSTPKEEPLSEAQKLWKNQDSDTRKLGYKILIQKFNEKYKDLNKDQKTLLAKFVNEDIASTSFRDFMYSEAARVKDLLTKRIRRVDDSVLQIKLHEVSKLLENIIGSRVIKNEYVSGMLKYYALVEKI